MASPVTLPSISHFVPSSSHFPLKAPLEVSVITQSPPIGAPPRPALTSSSRFQPPGVSASQSPKQAWAATGASPSVLDVRTAMRVRVASRKTRCSRSSMDVSVSWSFISSGFARRLLPALSNDDVHGATATAGVVDTSDGFFSSNERSALPFGASRLIRPKPGVASHLTVRDPILLVRGFLVWDAENGNRLTVVLKSVRDFLVGTEALRGRKVAPPSIDLPNTSKLRREAFLFRDPGFLGDTFGFDPSRLDRSQLNLDDRLDADLGQVKCTPRPSDPGWRWTKPLAVYVPEATSALWSALPL